MIHDRQREGRRIPHTLGDAPTWQFGARLKGPWDRPSNLSPGPVYKAEATLGPGGAPVFTKAPMFRFGPAGMRRRGMQQSRNEALKVSVTTMACSGKSNLNSCTVSNDIVCEAVG